MRIALVTDTFYPAVDGVTTTIKALADRMIDTGHEVRFIAPGPGLASYRGSTVIRTSPLAKTGAQVRAALDTYVPDVVLVIDPGRLGKRALDHARGIGLPSLVLQQSRVENPDQWQHKYGRKASEVTVTSGWLADVLDLEGDQVWYPGVDTAAFTPALRDPWLHRHWSQAKRSGEPALVVGYIGRLTKAGGVRRLAALDMVPGIRPVIIGTGPQQDWLADRLPNAKLTGTLDSGDLAIALATLDVLVHPGEEEGVGHVLREAAASGVPVVAPHRGVAPEIVGDQDTGLLYDPDAPGGVTAALNDAVAGLAGEADRARLGERARRLALTRSWTEAADELIERLALLISHPETSPAA